MSVKNINYLLIRELNSQRNKHDNKVCIFEMVACGVLPSLSSASAVAVCPTGRRAELFRP